MPLTVDAGPRINQVLPNTHYLARHAADLVGQHVEALAGRSYSGKTRVELTWKDGQIVEVIQAIDAKTR